MVQQADTDTVAAGSSQTVSISNAGGTADVVLVCEHASNFIPPEFTDLGLDARTRASHIAWDPGALGVASALSARLDAPLVAQNISRLVYDCNRPPEAAAAMPAVSEIYTVPGNSNLTADQRAIRTGTYYEPFRHALSSLIERRMAAGRAPAIITIHSFNPTYLGQPRKFDIGILHDVDSRLADELLVTLQANGRFDVRRNEPYGPADGVTHTLGVHALPRNLPNVMIEIRNDLIKTRAEQSELAQWMAPMIDIAVHDLPAAGMIRTGGRTVA